MRTPEHLKHDELYSCGKVIRFWSVAVGIFLFSHKGISEVTDVKRKDLGCSRCWDSSQRCSLGLRSWCRTPKFFHSNHGKPCMELALCPGTLSGWGRFGPLRTLEMKLCASSFVVKFGKGSHKPSST